MINCEASDAEPMRNDPEIGPPTVNSQRMGARTTSDFRRWAWFRASLKLPDFGLSGQMLRSGADDQSLTDHGSLASARLNKAVFHSFMAFLVGVRSPPTLPRPWDTRVLSPATPIPPPNPRANRDL
ncbi:uncharacterized protein LOC62_03G003767 [Vanrija pseudolonga]|uniref:Uncharacterized protein n=1 Tax=Vanrija pseudolonga TaxID=143232 RepID=A0AAF0Y5A6_9TREE|nr:hypothetical protein LOC62_03G003767 [Vanrija pseudolonga]